MKMALFDDVSENKGCPPGTPVWWARAQRAHSDVVQNEAHR